MAVRHRGNFNILGNFTYFVPDFTELLMLLLWFVVGTLAGNVINFLSGLFFGAESALEYGMIVAYPVMFIPAMLYASLKSRRNSLHCAGARMDSCNFSPLGGALCVLLAVAGTFSLGFCADAVGLVLPSMPDWLKRALEGMTSGNFWINFLCVSIFAPIFEEWLCRGMVMRGLLLNGMKPVWSIAVSAAFFSLIHLNLWQAIPAFLLGCLFGYVYFRTGSLKLTMLMHFTNNTIALLMSRIPSLENMETWRDLFTGPEYFLMLGCTAIVTVLVILALGRIPVKDGAGNIDRVPPIFEK